MVKENTSSSSERKASGPNHRVKNAKSFKGKREPATKRLFTRHNKHKPNMKQRRKMRENQGPDGGSTSMQTADGKAPASKKNGGKRKLAQTQTGEAGTRAKVQHVGTAENGATTQAPAKPASNPKVAKLKSFLSQKLGNEPSESGPAGDVSAVEAQPQLKKPGAAISSNWLALSQRMKQDKKAAKKGKKATSGNDGKAATALPRGKVQGSGPGKTIPEGDLKRFQAPIAMDCEMVGVGDDGKRSVLARVSLVDVNGDVVMDTFVAPKEKVTDLRTFVSGVRYQDLRGAPQFSAVQKKVSEITSNKLLVGHALKNDLTALLLSHPKHLIRDTAKYRPFQSANKKARKLQTLASELLGLDIQSGEHSSVEDARAALLLYKHSQTQWEKEMARKATIALKNKKQPGGAVKGE